MESLFALFMNISFVEPRKFGVFPPHMLLMSNFGFWTTTFVVTPQILTGKKNSTIFLHYAENIKHKSSPFNIIQYKIL